MRGRAATGRRLLGRAVLTALPGDPVNPGAWLATTARHRALDRVRRSRVYAGKLAELERQVARTVSSPSWQLPEVRRQRWGHPRRAELCGGRYFTEASIALVHATAPTYEQTDWAAAPGGYQRLLGLNPSPVVRLNHAVAAAMARGPDADLRLLVGLDAELGDYHYLHAARGELLRLAGDRPAARAAVQRALGLVGNEPERRLLRARLAALTGPEPGRQLAVSPPGCRPSSPPS